VDYKPHIPEVFEAMRRKAVEDGVGPMPAQKVIAQSMRSYDNPYQGPRRVRTDWTAPSKKKKNPLKTFFKSRPRIITLWAAPAPTTPRTSHCSGHGLHFPKTGVDFGILGENELCCGSTAMRTGRRRGLQTGAETNLDTFRKLRSGTGCQNHRYRCAGCYRAILKDYSLSEEYGQMMEGINVIHVTQFLYDLYKAGNLKFTQTLPMKVTYHDPCHSGRHLTKFIVDQDGSQLWAGAYISLNEEDCLYDPPGNC